MLIGSRALAFYGYECEENYNSDWDLVVTSETLNIFKQLEMKQNPNVSSQFRVISGSEKDGDISVYDITNVDDMSCDKSLRELYNYVLTVDVDVESQKQFDIEINDQVLQFTVCPLMLLYALKKSHIHRILSLSSNPVKTWLRHIHMYNWMRENLGYEEMDRITYGKINSENPLEVACRKIYELGFQETNDRVGDAPALLNLPMEDFFTDNVPRTIEHDKLHEKVALFYRNDKRLLFESFKTKPTDTCMDESLFTNASFEDRIQTLIEEVAVLWLERKIIPKMMDCIEKDESFNDISLEEGIESFEDVLSHFVTNLCGDGHHWLRRFALDHFYMISSIEMYQLQNLVQLAFQITNVKQKSVKIVKSFKEAFKLIKSQGTSGFNMRTFPQDAIYKQKKHISSELYQCDAIKKLLTDNLLSPMIKETLKLFVKVSYHPPIIKYVMAGEGKVYMNSSNIGLFVTSSDVYLFSLILKIEHNRYYFQNENETDDFTVIANIHHFQHEDMKERQRSNMYVTRETRKHYYYSRDRSCGYRNENDAGHTERISSYGYIPIINGFVETTMKNYLKVDSLDTEHTEKRPMNGWEVSDEDASGGYSDEDW
jgi:hypothetical protein